MKAILARLQPLGRALMLPIAVLPVAGLLLRLGQPDLLDIPFIAAAGNAIFGHLGLLFAIGVGVGLARENHGAAGLAGAVAYFVTIEGAKTLLKVPPEIGAGLVDTTRETVAAAWREAEIGRLSVPAGLLSGLGAGLFYNRYSEIKLPDFLAFFGGRRFVPILAGFLGLGLALIFGLGFPLLVSAMDMLSRWVAGAGPLGLFLFGVLNRLLIVTGLHHILNNIAWFIVGDFHGATGDLKRFFAGDPSAGGFMAGFFPVMMFGLPAACLAMYRTALPERRKAVGGLLLSIAATSFLTGVTEPIEFSFMFLAPALYALHAVLTGLSMALMDWLGVRLGFGFSAGLFDYVLNYGIATRPLLLIPVGLGYGVVYYASFSWAIRRFDLKTPGREPAEQEVSFVRTTGDRDARFMEALGGPSNLISIDACTTRLRLRVFDFNRVDESALKVLGARGVFRPGADALQVVLGPIADQVATEIRTASRQGDTDIERLAAVLAPLGPVALTVRDTRLLLKTAKPVGANVQEALLQAGVRAVAASDTITHLIVGRDATAIGERLVRALGIENVSVFSY